MSTAPEGPGMARVVDRAQSRSLSPRSERTPAAFRSGPGGGELGAEEGVERGRGQPPPEGEQPVGERPDGIPGARAAPGRGPGHHRGDVTGRDREPPGDVAGPPA